MASTTVQWQFLTLASVLQLLRGAAWFTIAVILGAQAIDPTIGASVSVLRNLMLPSVALATLAVLFLRLAQEGELRQRLLEQGLDPRQVRRAVRYGRAGDLGI